MTEALLADRALVQNHPDIKWVLNKSHFTYFSMSYKLIFGPLKELILGGIIALKGATYIDVVECDEYI